MDATDRKHVNTSCSDTVKCRLDAGKSPIFRSQSPCTEISVRKSQRVAVFVRIYPYESLKGLIKDNLFSVTESLIRMTLYNIHLATSANSHYKITISVYSLDTFLKRLPVIYNNINC